MLPAFLILASNLDTYKALLSTKISYASSKVGWHEFVPFLKECIEKHSLNKVCDVGGGANPMLEKEYVSQQGLDYSLLDISQGELDKAPKNYRKILADISSPEFHSDQEFDLIFSKMLAEHIYDAENFHKNVLSLLSDKGMAVHFFPTLFAFPFVVNYLIPERLANKLLNLFSPRDRYQYGKFPAYYHWCYGPSRKQLNRFISLGYEIVEYRGFFGHSYYNRIKPLKKLHNLKTNYLVSHPKSFFTSYAYVVLKKASKS
ncbi:MAG: hypothetical protein Aureis2KO_24310 [Aureisphaera sp.]